MLRQAGVGVEKRHCGVLDVMAENKLWESKVLGAHSPKALLNTVFYLNGKNFSLRGVDEQYNLRFSQLIRSDDGQQYTYIEHGSKNHSGSLADDTDNKVVPIRRVPGAGERDHVMILDIYLSRVPQNLPRESRFYLRAMSKVP